MSSLISVKNLSRYYADSCAVKNISFELAAGEILGFLGPNGAGKSTTMQMLSGNLAPSTGEITINGVDLLDKPKLAKTELGYLPEIPPLYKDMSVDEYLTYAAKLHRIKSSEITDAIYTAKEHCGLGASSKRLIGNLSKGYQQRVGIAQAILHSPKVIILDEPTVGLDPHQIRGIRSLISELGKSHGIILCSHILPEIQAVCNRVQIIHQGELVYTSNIKELLGHRATGALEVSFKHPPDSDVLMMLDCITSAEVGSNDGFIVQCSNTDELIKASLEYRWGLNRLVPQELTLEQIFVNLTSADTTIDEDDDTERQEHVARKEKAA